MMDSFELNKLIGAFLAIVFVVFSVSIVSDTIFATHAPETPGYVIEVAEVEAGAAEDAVEEVSVVALLADADPAAGQAAFRRCAACHTAEQGGANRVGPNLWDIVNRPIAAKDGFSYSGAMRELATVGSGVWDFEHLSGFLRAPRAYVPGTTMAFAGISNPQEEANLIAYLRELSDDPAPLPEIAPAAEDAVDTQALPVEPTPDDDGTSAAPEVDAGTPAPSEAEIAPTEPETAPVDEAEETDESEN